jgi:hypothetical protein
MQRAMHAHAAKVQRLGGSGDIAFLHEGHKNGQLAKGEITGDVGVHLSLPA